VTGIEKDAERGEDVEPERERVGYSERLPRRLLKLFRRAMVSFATSDLRASDAGEVDGLASIDFRGGVEVSAGAASGAGVGVDGRLPPVRSAASCLASSCRNTEFKTPIASLEPVGGWLFLLSNL